MAPIRNFIFFLSRLFQPSSRVQLHCIVVVSLSSEHIIIFTNVEDEWATHSNVATTCHTQHIHATHRWGHYAPWHTILYAIHKVGPRAKRIEQSITTTKNKCIKRSRKECERAWQLGLEIRETSVAGSRTKGRSKDDGYTLCCSTLFTYLR